jgi:hypothetical protein
MLSYDAKALESKVGTLLELASHHNNTPSQANCGGFFIYIIDKKFLNDPDLNNLFERIKLQIRIDQERAKAEQESLPKQQE